MIIFLYVPHLEILPFKRQPVSFRRAKLYKKGEMKDDRIRTKLYQYVSRYADARAFGAHRRGGEGLAGRR